MLAIDETSLPADVTAGSPDEATVTVVIYDGKNSNKLLFSFNKIHHFKMTS